MAEPGSTAVLGMTAAGVTVFGVATGLQPDLALAGLWGGWWALRFLPPMSILSRISSVATASIISAWATPAVAAGLTGFAWWPKEVGYNLLKFPVAVGFGLLLHTVIGPALIRFGQKKAQEVGE